MSGKLYPITPQVHPCKIFPIPERKIWEGGLEEIAGKADEGIFTSGDPRPSESPDSMLLWPPQAP